MEIGSIDVFHVGLPLATPQAVGERSVDALETVLVRMRSGELEGWGEASPGTAPVKGADWAAGAFVCLRDWLAPAVAGSYVETAETLHERMAHIQGNRFAKAALDMAYWDLRARSEEKPLAELLDARRDAITVGPTFDQIESIDAFMDGIGDAYGVGYQRVKVMIRPGWDIQMLDFVRREFPTQMLFGDAEAGMTLSHTDTIYRFEDFSLDLFEQPLPADDLVGHAMIQDSLHTPICLDESIAKVRDAEVALELKSCRAMNIEPGRAGGLTPATEIHDLCRAESVPCYVGTRPQSGIGVRFGLALAAKENFTLPADLAQADLATDVVPVLEPSRPDNEGHMQIPLWSEPGLGVTPDAAVLEEHLRQRATVE
jgi:O-succinylbenzoate synthase